MHIVCSGLVITLGVFVGCSNGGTNASAPEPTAARIQIVGIANNTLEPIGLNYRLSVAAYSSAGEQLALPISGVTWSTSDSAIARVDSTGFVSDLGGGNVEMYARARYADAVLTDSVYVMYGNYSLAQRVPTSGRDRWP
jgi:hypothetical protein